LRSKDKQSLLCYQAIGREVRILHHRETLYLLRRKTEEKVEQQRVLYEKLIETTQQMVQQAERVVAALGEQTEAQAQRLRSKAEQVLPLIKGVMAQTRSRVLEGKQVASADQVLSLFEPHTRAIPRHKGGAQVEFGRQVMLDEVEGGIVTRFQILEHPDEHGQATEAVAHHRALFEHPVVATWDIRSLNRPFASVRYLAFITFLGEFM
jgi:IS5 family transposase